MKILRLTIESILLLFLAFLFFVFPFTSSRPLYLQVGVVWIGLCFLQVFIHHVQPGDPVAEKILVVLRYCGNGLFVVFGALGLYHYLAAPL